MREVHHVALLIGYGASAVNPYLAMETCENLVRSGFITGVTPEKAVDEPDQGARQGRAEDHVEDGHLDGLLLRRRPGVRGDRPRPRSSSTQYFTGTDSKLGGVGIDVIAAENLPPGTRPPTRRTPPLAARAPAGPAASTSGAATARRTCSTRTPSSGCSTRPAPAATTSSASTPSSSTTRPRPDDAARPVRAQAPASAQPVPLDEVESVARSSSASPPAR